jgi:hypothetical protein
MKRQSWSSFIVVLALIGLTAGFLLRQQATQKLGIPGVKVIPEPTYDNEGKLVASNSVYLPENILNYKSEIRPITQDTLSWLPKDTTYGQRLYTAPDGFQSALNVVLMGRDRTSIHRPEWCLAGVGWATDPQEVTTIPISEPHPYQLSIMKLTATKKIVKAEGQQPVVGRVVYVYWFVADHELTARPDQRMRWMARDLLLTGVLQRWAYVACIGYCSPGQEEATFNRMKELISAAVPRFQLATGAPAPLARNP